MIEEIYAFFKKFKFSEKIALIKILLLDTFTSFYVYDIACLRQQVESFFMFFIFMFFWGISLTDCEFKVE